MSKSRMLTFFEKKKYAILIDFPRHCWPKTKVHLFSIELVTIFRHFCGFLFTIVVFYLNLKQERQHHQKVKYLPQIQLWRV